MTDKLMKKSLLMIGPLKPGVSTKMLIEEAEKVFKKVTYAPVSQIVLHLTNKKCVMLYGKEDLSKYDYCLPRIDSKRAQHGFHVIRFMDMIGMPKPYGAETVLIAHNKYMTLETLQKADVPIAGAYMADSAEAVKSILKKVKYPIVVKIVDGFGGQGVMIFNDASTAKSAIETLKLLKHQVIIEDFIENPGEDIRAFIVGGKIVASMKRVAAKGEDRANIMLGGHGEYMTLTGEMKDVALKAASATGSDIVAVDLIEGQKGPKVIEVNINPGIKGIKKATNTNVAKSIIDFVKDQLKNE